MQKMIMFFSQTEKRYLFILHASILVISTLLGVLVLTDIRLSTLGEPFGDYLMAMSIAISRLVYGVEGLVGFEQVLDLLKQIPNASQINLDSTEAYANYQIMINDVLQKATHLNNINQEKIHAYVYYQAHLYYVIIAFWLFGIKIQSLSYFWLLLFWGSILSFSVAFRKKIIILLILWFLLISITLIIISNPGVGSQLRTVNNYRFVPILGIIPLFHMVFSINNQQKKLVDWILILTQMLIFVFVLLIRSSALWMLIAMALALVYTAWSYGQEWNVCTVNTGKKKLFGAIVSQIAPIVIIIVIFLLAKNAMPKFLHEEYKKDLWVQSHVIWHSSVVGLTMDPVLKKKYVCSNKLLTDQLVGFSPVSCDERPLLYQRLANDIFDQPSDMHGFQAAIRYLRERGSDEQIGGDIRKPDYLNLKWHRYEEIMQKVFFEMLMQNPFDLMYMYTIIKPLRYLKEVTWYAKYFGKSLLRSPILFGVLSFLISIVSLNYYLVRRFRFLMLNAQSHLRDGVKVVRRTLLIIFLSSLMPSLVFYSQAHTIADSVVVLLVAIFFFHLTSRPLRRRI